MDGIDDVKEFQDTLSAMGVMDLSAAQQVSQPISTCHKLITACYWHALPDPWCPQWSVLKMVATVLHLGNIQFAENGNYAQVLSHGSLPYCAPQGFCLSLVRQYRVSPSLQVADPSFLDFPAFLIGVDPAVLQEKLTTRLMTSKWGGKSETTVVTLTVEQVNCSC